MKKHLSLFLALLMAGSTLATLSACNQGKHDWELEQKSVLHKQPFFAIDPYVGIEYAVGEALRLTLKADWLLAINSDGLNRPMGPRIYFGFIFAH